MSRLPPIMAHSILQKKFEMEVGSTKSITDETAEAVTHDLSLDSHGL